MGDIFGSWPNATQGIIGAALGVLVAFFVAFFTARHEIRQERKRALDAISAQAAAELVIAITELEAELTRVRTLQPTPRTIYRREDADRWNEKVAALQLVVRQHVLFVPEVIGPAINRLVGTARKLFTVSRTPPGFESHGEPPWLAVEWSSVVAADLDSHFNYVIHQLQAYRREQHAAQWTKKPKDPDDERKLPSQEEPPPRPNLSGSTGPDDDTFVPPEPVP